LRRGVLRNNAQKWVFRRTARATASRRFSRALITAIYLDGRGEDELCCQPDAENALLTYALRKKRAFSVRVADKDALDDFVRLMGRNRRARRLFHSPESVFLRAFLSAMGPYARLYMAY
jgi:hypothetical protein